MLRHIQSSPDIIIPISVGKFSFKIILYCSPVLILVAKYGVFVSNSTPIIPMFSGKYGAFVLNSLPGPVGKYGIISSLK